MESSIEQQTKVCAAFMSKSLVFIHYLLYHTNKCERRWKKEIVESGKFGIEMKLGQGKTLNGGGGEDEYGMKREYRWR